MRLFIAEKPSLARAIADALPGHQQRRNGHILCGADDVVAWCAGHILELAPPDAYNPDYKRWRLEHLPIVPAEWRLTVSAPELLRTIEALLPRATRVVHAGDPDREGQLLVDEVLDYLGYRGPVDRLLIADLNRPAVQKALGAMRSNGHYRGLSDAALARQRADWLYGINLTRLYTVLGRSGGYDGVLSVGRVQTPLLGLIVRRDLEIERFQPQPYFVPRANVRAGAHNFTATWHPPSDGRVPLDPSGRLLSRERAVAIRNNVRGQTGSVVSATREKKAEPPPLPYSLPDLQIDAGKRLGLGAKQTLDACQALYETHRLLTYPRSDCRYLPEGQREQATVVLAAIASNVPSLVALAGKADRARRSRAWDDAKMTAHHAIIPTPELRTDVRLSSTEAAIYELVARRYLAQFHPPFEYHETKIALDVDGERFRASGREVLGEGWRACDAPASAQAADGAIDDGSAADREEQSQTLPLLRDGEPVAIQEIAIAERQTTAPKRFSDATLIQAMTGIGRFVEDPKIKQLLRETDGIGTPATQAQIIQTLFERQYIEKRGRQVHATGVGRALIEALPPTVTKPDMTALWEAAMRRIADGAMPLSSFLDAVLKQLREIVCAGRGLGALRVPVTDGRANERPAAGPRTARQRRRRQTSRVSSSTPQ